MRLHVNKNNDGNRGLSKTFERSSSFGRWIFLVAYFLRSNILLANGQQLHTLIRNIQRQYPEYKPDAVIDIGANAGKYASAIREIYPYTRIVMIEASEQHRQKLQNFVQNDTNKSEFYITVLSNTNDQTVDFYDSDRANTGNSIFREHSKHFANLKPLQKTTKTVDSIVSQSKLLENTVVDIIKADVQGAELLVFQGARHVLEQASFVQFEGSSIEWNEGGSCWHEVDVLLRSHGFYLYDMGDFLYNGPAFKTKGVGQFDVIYVKPSSTRLPKFLIEKEPKFCGAGRETKSQTKTAVLSHRSLELGFDDFERHVNSKTHDISLEWYVGFVSGFCLSFFLQLLQAKRKISFI